MPTLCLKKISEELYIWACSACGREFDKDPRDAAPARLTPPGSAFREHCSQDHAGEPVNIPRI